MESEIVQNIEIPMNVTTGSAFQGSDVLSSSSSNTNPLLGTACTSASSASSQSPDRLRFHTRCGSLVKLSNGNRTGERRRPLDEFNNGVVMTNRPLKDNELFEIRIDKLVDKWSGSIEVGVTTHNPNALNFPATMTNMRSGTIMMSGCGILTNGKGTRREYGEFNLDELREGDRVGMMKKSNGNLHYYINGRDQGIAATRVAQILWGVIDLYGMTIKVTIVDPDEREQLNLVTRRTIGSSATGGLPAITMPKPICSESIGPIASDSDSQGLPSHRLTFHNICGSHACVTHSGRTALRPCASEDFNNGVVLTRRQLRPNELFQVRLECVVTKWAGSIEIGVTTHSPTELQFPFTMTNVRSGTWMMTGNGVMHNGITVLEQYGQNLDRLQVGDRVGVVRKDDGTLHFWVNGIDQGPAATNVPDRVYGVIDLYGQAAQASIVDTSEVCSPDTGNSTISNTTLYGNEPRLKFHQIHGRNARVTNNGMTAHRQKAVETYDDSILFSNRPLRQRETFEVVLDTVTCHWKDSISIGVTGVRPEDISLSRTATGLHQEAIVVSGNALLLNGVTIRKEFLPFHLDSLKVGTRLGVQLNGDFVHFFIDGVDYGPAYECKVQSVYAVIDLYGQCSKVNILPVGAIINGTDIRAPYATSENSQSIQAPSVINPGLTIGSRHRFSHVTSGDVNTTDNQTVASTSGESWSEGLCFSSNILEMGEHVEIRVTKMNLRFAGCLKIGVTDLNLNDGRLTKNLPSLIRQLPANVYFVSGDGVWINKTMQNRSYASLEWLRLGDTLTVELTTTRTVRILINGEDMNIQFMNVDSRDLYLVVELQGATTGVEIVSTVGPSSPLRPCSLRLQDSLEYVLDPLNNRQQDSMLESIDSDFFTFEFTHDFHGENIRIADDRKMAQRMKSYNYGCIGISKPLCKGHSICIKVEEINPKWKGTLAIGAVGVAPHHINFNALTSSLVLRRPCWIVTHDYVNVNGHKTRSNYGEVLDRIQRGTIVTMMLTHSGSLVLMVDKTNLEVFATGLPNHVYPVFDLYGKCEKITILNVEVRNGTPVNNEELPEEREPLTIGERNLEEDGDDIDNHNAMMPQCEKADLEIHEKEEQDSMIAIMMNYNNGSGPSTSSMDDTRIRNRMSENYWTNMNIKSRSKNELSNSTSLRDSLELHHSTNLNIQRSQSQQRFDSNCTQVYGEASGAGTTGATGPITNGDGNRSMSHSCHDSNYIDDRNYCEGMGTNYVLPMSTLESDIESLLLGDATEGDLGDDGGAGDANEEMDSECIVRSTTLAVADPLPLGTANSSLIMDLESIHCSLGGELSLRDTCDYFKLICGFKKTLVLPDEFFAGEVPVCFCPICSGAWVKGSRHYQLAQMLTGWVRFRLNEETTNAGNIVLESDEKTLAFYATTVDRIRSILDNGQLLPVATGSGQKDDGGGGVQLVLSASPNDNLRLHQHFNFRSHSYQIGTAFEVHVRSQSLCTSDEDTTSGLGSSTSTGTNAGPSSLLSSSSIAVVAAMTSPSVDSVLTNRLWTTKEAGACVLTALLLRLELVN